MFVWWFVQYVCANNIANYVARLLVQATTGV